MHKAFIAVDEVGTEASAATSMSAGASASSGALKIMKLDRPFLFAIRDLETGLLLFVGRVTLPVQP